jgi:hypothetical protein
LKRSRLPARKTPHLRQESPEVGSNPHELDPRIPSWAAKGRALSAALEEALRQGASSPKARACIERAYSTWTLDGMPPSYIARTAHLSRRAHEAIRSTSRSKLEEAYTDCARVLHQGLPSTIRRRVSMDIVVDAVRDMRQEADGWAAVVQATMLILGWTIGARVHFAEVVRQALEEHPPESSRAP